MIPRAAKPLNDAWSSSGAIRRRQAVKLNSRFHPAADALIDAMAQKMTHHRQLRSMLLALILGALASCDSQAPVDCGAEGQADSNPDLEKISTLQGDVTFTLEDGVALNQESPDTFWIPPKERRENLVKDDLVKLIFNLTDGEQTQGERMWVIVKGGDSSGYKGILDNDPYSTDQIKAGLEISFEPRHVIDIFEDEIPGNEDAEQGVAPQSATVPESKSEGSDKPQPESKPASR